MFLLTGLHTPPTHTHTHTHTHTEYHAVFRQADPQTRRFLYAGVWAVSCMLLIVVNLTGYGVGVSGVGEIVEKLASLEGRRTLAGSFIFMISCAGIAMDLEARRQQKARRD